MNELNIIKNKLKQFKNERNFNTVNSLITDVHQKLKKKKILVIEEEFLLITVRKYLFSYKIFISALELQVRPGSNTGLNTIGIYLKHKLHFCFY